MHYCWLPINRILQEKIHVFQVVRYTVVADTIAIDCLLNNADPSRAMGYDGNEFFYFFQ